jgi:hypothetical protein
MMGKERGLHLELDLEKSKSEALDSGKSESLKPEILNWRIER